MDETRKLLMDALVLINEALELADGYGADEGETFPSLSQQAAALESRARALLDDQQGEPQ